MNFFLKKLRQSVLYWNNKGKNCVKLWRRFADTYYIGNVTFSGSQENVFFLMSTKIDFSNHEKIALPILSMKWRTNIWNKFLFILLIFISITVAFPTPLTYMQRRCVSLGTFVKNNKKTLHLPTLSAARSAGEALLDLVSCISPLCHIHIHWTT